MIEQDRVHECHMVLEITTLQVAAGAVNVYSESVQCQHRGDYNVVTRQEMKLTIFHIWIKFSEV